MHIGHYPSLSTELYECSSSIVSRAPYELVLELTLRFGPVAAGTALGAAEDVVSPDADRNPEAEPEPEPATSSAGAHGAGLLSETLEKASLADESSEPVAADEADKVRASAVYTAIGSRRGSGVLETKLLQLSRWRMLSCVHDHGVTWLSCRDLRE